MLKISMTVAILAVSLVQQAKAGNITIKNQNCVWQGVIRTNQAKFHVFAEKSSRSNYGGPIDKLPYGCTNAWLTIGAGSTRTEQVVGLFENESDLVSGRRLYAREGLYIVQAEGVAGGDQDVRGTKDHKFKCQTDWLGVCQCRNE